MDAFVSRNEIKINREKQRQEEVDADLLNFKTGL